MHQRNIAANKQNVKNIYLNLALMDFSFLKALAGTWPYARTLLGSSWEIDLRFINKNEGLSIGWFWNLDFPWRL